MTSKSESSNSEFEIFKHYNTSKESQPIQSETQTPVYAERAKPEECPHSNVVHELGVGVCMDCGEEMYQKISQNKEVRNYGSDKVPDPVRGKIDDRTIFKDVENLGFSDAIVNKANQIYGQVTGGKIFRGKTRKAIIFACIFHAYKVTGKPQSHDKLIRIFDLNRKTGLKGLKFVNLSAPKDSKIRTTYISPKNLIEEIMDQFGSSEEQKNEVVDIYEAVRSKTSRLNRSRPQSVASAMVYYWISKKKKNITLKEFAKQVGLSELTIGKIAKEIAEVYET